MFLLEMSPSLSIAMLGHGAIASYVIEHIASVSDISVSAVICREASIERAKSFANNQFPIYTSVAQLPFKPDLLVDCAGHSGLECQAPIALKNGIDVISISTGALAQASVYEELEASANAGGSSIRFLSGAIGGIDALIAAGAGTLDQVVYIGRKPPNAWLNSPAEDKCDLANLVVPCTIFSGTAREAAKRYPKNANVAATVAFASIGMDNVEVELIADPAINQNMHEIRANGEFGKMHVTLEGNPLAKNSKTSALAAMSIVSELRQRTRRIGI